LVLVPHTRDAEWLNQQRPVFARRALRVILWCDRKTTEMLRTKAVDFFDWISHVHECPPEGVYVSPIDASVPELVRTTEAGDLDVAERAAMHALQATETEQWRRTPERAKALHVLGRIDVRRGRFRDAETNFRAALAINGDETPQLHVDLADVLMRQGRYAEALPIAHRAVSILRADSENTRRTLLEDAVKLVARIEKLAHYTRPNL
jgi:tetratricopeptide (TPR) repeat protein